MRAVKKNFLLRKIEGEDIAENTENTDNSPEETAETVENTDNAAEETTEEVNTEE